MITAVTSKLKGNEDHQTLFAIHFQGSLHGIIVHVGNKALSLCSNLKTARAMFTDSQFISPHWDDGINRACSARIVLEGQPYFLRLKSFPHLSPGPETRLG